MSAVEKYSSFETRPAYRILSVAGFFGPDDVLHKEGEEIYYDGEPNEEMEPLNDAAKERMEQYLNRLDDLAREVAEKTGKMFSARPRNLDGGLAMATAVARSEVAIMGAKKTDTGIERIKHSDEAAPHTGLDGVKRGRGRPKKIVDLTA